MPYLRRGNSEGVSSVTSLAWRTTDLLTRHQNFTIVLALGAWIEARALLLTGDANWDLLNYHLYDPFALFHHKWGIDIAPAQLQTYFAPTLDIPYYILVRNIHQIWLVNAILEIPHVVAAALTYLLALRILRADDFWGRWTAGVAALVGMTGAIGLSTAASTLSEMIPVCLTLGALLILVMPDSEAIISPSRVGLAGFLAGAAVGLKLTFVGAAVGLGVASIYLPAVSITQRSQRGLMLAAGGLAGALVTGGWWWFAALQRWGDPLFPFYNNIFHSPLIAPETGKDYRFVPRSAWNVIFYPFYLATGPNAWSGRLFKEYFRDPRIPLALLCSVGYPAYLLLRGRRDPAPAFVSVFFAVAYAFWEIQFSIIRYLSYLEPLTGIIIGAILFQVSGERPRVALPVMVLFLCCVSWMTVNPYWTRARPAQAPIVSSIPPVPGDSLIILADSSPLAFLATFEPDTVQFVGANNGIVHPGGRWGLDRMAAQAIRRHKGPIWELEHPFGEDAGRAANETLATYGLRRSQCVILRDNVPWSSERYETRDDHKAAIRMCRLSRSTPV